MQALACRRNASWTRRLSHLLERGITWRANAGLAPGPPSRRRGQCAKCDEAHNATAISLLLGHTFGFSVSSSSVQVRVRLLAAHQLQPRRLTSGGTDGGLALGKCRKCRRCLQDEGREEGKVPSTRAHERKEAAVATLRSGLTTLFSQLFAQPAHGLLQVDPSKVGVNLGALLAPPASTGLDSRSSPRDSHCEQEVEKVCEGGVGLMPVHRRANRRTSKAHGVN